MVEKIVGALAVTLTPGEEQRLRRRGTTNVEAYETWLRARELLIARHARVGRAGARAVPPRDRDRSAISPLRMRAWRLPRISDYVSDWAPDPAQALDEAETMGAPRASS